ncbi:nuclear transport factor 2 family protein [Tsukamurella sp. DT100]|uniref:nuclear transport factor 2 family protein n=1 Tax=Tsukamurella sp. DT100 TaxID=3393415 RepID=UPI003CECCBCF
MNSYTPSPGDRTPDENDGFAALVAAYLAMWNERDPRARQALAAAVFTPDAYYVDPNSAARGIAAIDAYVAGWQAQFPDSEFTRGALHGHHHVVYFEWSFGSPGNPPAGNGRDVAVVENGRISTVYGFFQ